MGDELLIILCNESCFAMINLEQIFQKYNFQKRSRPPAVAIESIEIITGFNLPEDYKFYLAGFDALEGFVREEYLFLWDADHLLQMNKDYGVSEKLPDILAIGCNGSSEFIGIEFNNSGGLRMVISSLITLNQEDFLNAGTSFKDMLIRLDQGINWFE